MIHVTIERRAADSLSNELWTFWYDERHHALRPSMYVRSTRPTVRHKFRNEAEWHQHHRGERNPPLPLDVMSEAIKQFRAGITVKPWEPNA